MNKNHIIGIVAGIIILVSSLFVTRDVNVGSAPDGVRAVIATSSTAVVGTASVTTLFTANTVCTSRLVSTVAQPIMLSFDSNITPTGVVGHYQAASTTVMYDSGLYGCDAMTAYGFNASSTITKSEFR